MAEKNGNTDNNNESIEKLVVATYETKFKARHLPDTEQSQRTIQRDGAAHVFNDEETLEYVAKTILEKGEKVGIIRGWERWGVYFDEPIGYRIDQSNQRTPLYYGEMKIRLDTRLYHVTPRTKPAT